ncbi:MAG: hypothetical protein ACTHMX_16890 [Thermomicrobiales bacterium]
MVPLDPQPTVVAQPTDPVAPAPPPTVTSGDESDLPNDSVVYSTIIHRTRLCPSAIYADASSAPLTALETACTASVQQTRFSVWQTQPLGPGTVGLATGDAGAEFQVPAGRYTSRIEPLEGYELVATACSTYPPRTRAVKSPFSTLPIAGAVSIWYRITTNVPMLKTTVCTWYLISPQDVADITAHVWTCPQGYDLAAADAAPALDCIVPADGIDMHLARAEGFNAAVWATSGDAGPGTLAFSNLPPIYEWRMSISLASEVKTAVSCNGSAIVRTKGIRVAVMPGGEAECHWYWVPPETASRDVPWADRTERIAPVSHSESGPPIPTVRPAIAKAAGAPTTGTSRPIP